MLKKILSGVVAVTFALGLAQTNSVPAQASVTINNGVCELSGSGTSSDQYLVSSKLDLYEIEEDCISGSGSIYFKQTQNIDLGGIHHNDIDSTDAHIIYDGDGFTINGMANLKNNTEHGLFGDVEDLTVSNLNLVATVILGEMTDIGEVGTLVGQVDNDLTVTNVNVLVGSFSAGSESGGLAGEVQGDAVITDTSVYIYNMIFLEDEMGLMIGEVDGSSTFTRVSAVAVSHQFPSDKTESVKELGIGGLVGDAGPFNVDQAYVDFGNSNSDSADPRTASSVGGIIGDSYSASGVGSYIRNAEVLMDVQGVAEFGGLVSDYETDTTVATTLEIRNVVVSAIASQSVRPEFSDYFNMGGLIGDIDSDDEEITVNIENTVVSAQFKDNLLDYQAYINWTNSSIAGEVLFMDSPLPGLLSVGNKVRISGMTDGVETEAGSGSAAILNDVHTVSAVNGREWQIDLSGTGIENDASLANGDATYTVVSDTTIDANSMIADYSSDTSFNFTDTYLNTTEWDKTEFPSFEGTTSKFSSSGISELTATQMQTKSNFAFESEIGDPGVDYQVSTFEMCSTGIHIAFNPGTCADPERRTFSSVASSYEVGKAITPITVTNTENGRDDVLLYEVEPSLPAGLAIDRATGKISGTPREATPATRYEIRTKTTGSQYDDSLDGHNDSYITFATVLPTPDTPDPEVIRDTVVIEREVPADYTGPLLTDVSAELVNRCQSTEMSLLGQDLDKLKKLYLGSTELSFEINNSRLVFTLPCVDAGEYSLKLESDGGTLEYKRLFNLVDVATGESSVVRDFTADQVVNAGSFKGYVAVYAKGYEGKKLSAKIGNDWVIVDSLASDFERITDFTGAGYDISVTIFIDGVLTRTVDLRTQ